MRILQINKFFYPKGGSETYYFSLCNLLEKHKHDVVHFSMQDNKNENSPYKDYFVSHLNITKPQVNLSSIGQISRLIWSNEAQKKLEQLLTKEKTCFATAFGLCKEIKLLTNFSTIAFLASIISVFSGALVLVAIPEISLF